MRMAVVLGLVVVATIANAKPNKIPKSEPRAIVFVIDRSGSMQGAKLEVARNAVLAAVDAIGPTDRVSLVVFDSEATVVFKDLRAAKRAEIKKAIKGIRPGRGTNIFPGLKEAFEVLQGTNVRTKHVVLLSDGEAPTDGLAELVGDMRSSRITVSAVGVQGADRKMLALIADTGAGRLFMVEELDALPEVFVKETLDGLKRSD